MIETTLAAIKAHLEKEYPELNASLNPPATEADITRFEATLGVTLPDDLKKLYRLHNGESNDAGLFFGLPFIGVDEALSEWKTWASLKESTATLDNDIISVPAGHIKEQYVNTRCIPISKDYGGNNIGIDLDPGPGGSAGQVINFGRDEDTRFVIATSLSGFLEFILHNLKNGNYHFDINGEDEPRSFLMKEPANSHFLDTLKHLQLPFGSKPPATATMEEDYDTWFASLDATWQGIIGTGKDFAALAGLRTLNLIKKELTDLRPVRYFTGLRELLLSANPVEDISPLASLTALNKLYLAKTNVRDLSPLTHLRELKQLSLSGTPVTSLAALSQLPKLKDLSIEDTAVPDLSEVGALRQLTELNIAGKQFPSFSELAGLKHLVKLNLSGTNIGDLSVISGLPKLTDLELCETQVADITFLLQLNKLTSITLTIADFKQIVDRLRPGISITICGEMTEEEDALLWSYVSKQ